MKAQTWLKKLKVNTLSLISMWERKNYNIFFQVGVKYLSPQDKSQILNVSHNLKNIYL